MTGRPARMGFGLDDGDRLEFSGDLASGKSGAFVENFRIRYFSDFVIKKFDNRLIVIEISGRKSELEENSSIEVIL